MQNRGLQDPAKCDRLLGLPLLAAALLLERFVEVGPERSAKGRQVGAARREEALAFWIVRKRVEQVLERQVRVPARDGLAERNGENDFKSG
jgi:hypothetical protein